MEEDDVTFAYRRWLHPTAAFRLPALTNKSAASWLVSCSPLGSLPSQAVSTGRQASMLLVSVNLPELGELWGPSGSVALWRWGLGSPCKASGVMEAVKAKTVILENLWFKAKR